MGNNTAHDETGNTDSNPAMARDSELRRFSVAPMMDWTDRHCRMLHRTLSQEALLYSEMVTTGALIYGEAERYLRYNTAEHPVALQLGGSDPQALAQCARLAEQYGYDEVNLNVGCPSDRVQNNLIGACLMAYPDRVRDCLAAMQDAVNIPITVKFRLGIDELDSDDYLHQFVDTLQSSGCQRFIVHARKAILQGLNPKQNRDVPPLQYPRVYRLKQAFPQLTVVINGGINSLSEAQTHLEQVDGVMLGRAAYHTPYLLAEVDRQIFQRDTPVISRLDALERYLPYVEEELAHGTALHHITRHLLGLFHGERGGKQFRRVISEQAHRPGADISVLHRAIEKLTF